MRNVCIKLFCASCGFVAGSGLRIHHITKSQAISRTSCVAGPEIVETIEGSNHARDHSLSRRNNIGDYDAATMDDMYIDASSDVSTNPDNHERQHKLCSVGGVGLQRDTSKRCKDGTMQINGEVILKPKIAVLLKLEGKTRRRR
jgi:hypothetical protein